MIFFRQLGVWGHRPSQAEIEFDRCRPLKFRSRLIPTGQQVGEMEVLESWAVVLVFSGSLCGGIWLRHGKVDDSADIYRAILTGNADATAERVISFLSVAILRSPTGIICFRKEIRFYGWFVFMVGCRAVLFLINRAACEKMCFSLVFTAENPADEKGVGHHVDRDDTDTKKDLYLPGQAGGIYHRQQIVFYKGARIARRTAGAS